MLIEKQSSASGKLHRGGNPARGRPDRNQHFNFAFKGFSTTQLPSRLRCDYPWRHEFFLRPQHRPAKRHVPIRDECKSALPQFARHRAHSAMAFPFHSFCPSHQFFRASHAAQSGSIVLAGQSPIRNQPTAGPNLPCPNRSIDGRPRNWPQTNHGRRQTAYLPRQRVEQFLAERHNPVVPATSLGRKVFSADPIFPAIVFWPMQRTHSVPKQKRPASSGLAPSTSSGPARWRAFRPTTRPAARAARRQRAGKRDPPGSFCVRKECRSPARSRTPRAPASARSRIYQPEPSLKFPVPACRARSRTRREPPDSDPAHALEGGPAKSPRSL